MLESQGGFQVERIGPRVKTHKHGSRRQYNHPANKAGYSNRMRSHYHTLILIPADSTCRSSRTTRHLCSLRISCSIHCKQSSMIEKSQIKAFRILTYRHPEWYYFEDGFDAKV